MPSRFRCPTCARLLEPPNVVSPGSPLRCPRCATVFSALAWEDEEPLVGQDARAHPEDRWPPDRDEDSPHYARRSWSNADLDHRGDYPRGNRVDVRKRGIPALVWAVGGIGLFLLLACGLIGIAAWRVATAADWKDFTSPEGGFTATFPATPSKKSQVDALGNTTNMLFAETNWGHVAYFVAFTDIPGADNADADEILNAVTTALTSVTSKRPIRVSGHPGIEAEGETLHNGIRMDVTNRVYLVRGRLYQVMVVREKGHSQSAEVLKFLDSFRLNNAALPG